MGEVHHLFFRSMPHYHLKRATAAVRAHLEKNGKSHLYKYEKTLDYFIEIFKQYRKQYNADLETKNKKE